MCIVKVIKLLKIRIRTLNRIVLHLNSIVSCSWSILGLEVTTAIKRFLTSISMPSRDEFNYIVTLIPKFPGATIIKVQAKFCCCNTIYKVISKLLVSKIKPLLPSIIPPNKSAFIMGRLLLENVLLASKGHKQLTLKVDILAKAFDSLSWDFLVACLSALDLHPIFIAWIRECISTPAYPLGISGCLHGYFSRYKRHPPRRSPMERMFGSRHVALCCLGNSDKSKRRGRVGAQRHSSRLE